MDLRNRMNGIPPDADAGDGVRSGSASDPSSSLLSISLSLLLSPESLTKATRLRCEARAARKKEREARDGG